jgi:hypothetical protein
VKVSRYTEWCPATTEGTLLQMLALLRSETAQPHFLRRSSDVMCPSLGFACGKLGFELNDILFTLREVNRTYGPKGTEWEKVRYS